MAKKNGVNSSRGEPAGISAREFFLRETPGQKLIDAHYQARISYNTLSDYMKNPKKALSVPVAKKLAAWSKGEISAARTAGLDE